MRRDLHKQPGDLTGDEGIMLKNWESIKEAHP